MSAPCRGDGATYVAQKMGASNMRDAAALVVVDGPSLELRARALWAREVALALRELADNLEQDAALDERIAERGEVLGVFRDVRGGGAGRRR